MAGQRRCDCGARATKYQSGGPACNRCAQIETRMEEFHRETVGIRV